MLNFNHGALGLYISDSNITGVYVEKDRKGLIWVKDAFNYHLAAKGMPDQERAIDKQHLTRELKAILKEKGLTGKKTTFAINSGHLINRLVNMPILTKAELKEAACWEIKPFLALGIEQMTFDYAVLQEIKDENNREIYQVYIAAMPKSMVTHNIKLVRESGLVPWRLESVWIVLFRLWQLLKIENGREDANDNYLPCLFFCDHNKGHIIVNDLFQGFTVRQTIRQKQEQDNIIIDEFNHIKLYLQEKYQKNINRVVVIGDSVKRYHTALTNLGEEMGSIDINDILKIARTSGAEEYLKEFSEHYTGNFAIALGLGIGEMLNEAN